MDRMTQTTAVVGLVCVAMTYATGEEQKKEQMQRQIDMPAPAGESGNT